jgi:hypothetical protein
MFITESEMKNATSAFGELPCHTCLVKPTCYHEENKTYNFKWIHPKKICDLYKEWIKNATNYVNDFIMYKFNLDLVYISEPQMKKIISEIGEIPCEACGILEKYFCYHEGYTDTTGDSLKSIINSNKQTGKTIFTGEICESYQKWMDEVKKRINNSHMYIFVEE